jgi:hypothetical protein
MQATTPRFSSQLPKPLIIKIWGTKKVFLLLLRHPAVLNKEWRIEIAEKRLASRATRRQHT